MQPGHSPPSPSLPLHICPNTRGHTPLSFSTYIHGPHSPAPLTPPVLPQSTFAHFPHNTTNPPHDSTTETILALTVPLRGSPGLPTSVQTWLEPISWPRFCLPVPSARTREKSGAPQAAPLTAHGYRPGPPGLSAPTPSPILPLGVGELSESRAPRGLGLGVRGLRAPLRARLSAPGPRRAGAGQWAPGLRPQRRPRWAEGGGNGALKADVSARRWSLPSRVRRSRRRSPRSAGPDIPNPDPNAAGRRTGRPDSPEPSWLSPASTPLPSPVPNSKNCNPG